MKTYGLNTPYTYLCLGMALFLSAMAWFAYEQDRRLPHVEPAAVEVEPFVESATPVVGCSADAIYVFSGYGDDYELQHSELPAREKLQLPMFPGCEMDEAYRKRFICSVFRMNEFIYRHADFPESAEKGATIVSFVIDKVSGKLVEEKVEVSPSPANAKEALRIIRLIKERDIRFTPGKIDGEPACIRMKAAVMNL